MSASREVIGDGPGGPIPPEGELRYAATMVTGPSFARSPDRAERRHRLRRFAPNEVRG